MSTKHASVDLHLEGGRGLGFGFRTEAMNRGGQRLLLDLWSSFVVVTGWSLGSRGPTVHYRVSNLRAEPEVSKSPLFYTED